MNIMLVGGISLMMRSLSIKLHKEGHRLYVLTGSRNPGNHYPHAFERYDFPYDSPSVEEVFRSVQPDVTILLGAFDGNSHTFTFNVPPEKGRKRKRDRDNRRG